MDIGEVLTRAWQIIWKHKVLWIFGILAGCVNGGGGGGGNGARRSFNPSNESSNLPPYWQHFFSQFSQEQIVLFVILGIIILLLIIVIAIFLGTVGRIALIRGAQQADQGAERLSFGELFKGSLPYFWRVFLLGLIVGLIFAVLVIALIIVGVLGSIVTLGIGLICFIPFICLLIPVGAFITLLIEQASIAIVIENKSIFDGLNRGWEVIKANAGTMVIMWLILTLGGWIAGLIIFLPIAVILLPVIVAFAANNWQPMWSALLIGGICLVAYLPVLLVLGGILRSYIQTAWTLTYLRLTAPKVQPPVPEPLPEPSPAPSPEPAA